MVIANLHVRRAAIGIPRCLDVDLRTDAARTRLTALVTATAVMMPRR